MLGRLYGVLNIKIGPQKGPKSAILEVFQLFSKTVRWKLLIFAPNVVLAFPDHLVRSDWMAHFDEGYLGKSYGVRTYSHKNQSVTN